MAPKKTLYDHAMQKLEKEPAPNASLLDRAKDLGIDAALAPNVFVEAGIGLGDLVSGGRFGKALEEGPAHGSPAKEFGKAIFEGLGNAVYGPLTPEAREEFRASPLGLSTHKTREVLEDNYSAERLEERFQASEAYERNFLEGLGESFTNPADVIGSVVQSVPQMLMGGALAKGMGAVLPKLPGYVAGAAGEGLLGAGSAAESIRNENDDRLLSGKQSAMAVASGLGTAAFNVVGGKLSKKLGIEDADLLGSGQKIEDIVGENAKKTLMRRALEGIMTEGVFEELPQSVQETIWQNLATGKEWDEGLSEAAGMGLLSGGAMGSVMGVKTGTQWKMHQSILEKEERTKRLLREAQNLDLDIDEQRKEDVVEGTQPVSLNPDAPTLDEQARDDQDDELAESIANKATEGVEEIVTEGVQEIDQAIVDDKTAIELQDDDGKLFQVNGDPESASAELDKQLITLMEKYNVRVDQMEELATKYGLDAVGVTDVLNKIIAVKDDRSIDTLPEEAAHMSMELIGLPYYGNRNQDMLPSHKASQEVLAQLMQDINKWDKFAPLYEEYMALYDGNEQKVRFEIVGKLVAETMVSKHKGQNSLMIRAWNFIKKAIQAVREMLGKDHNFSNASKIADTILSGDLGIDTRTEGKQPLRYHEAVESNPIVRFVNEPMEKLGGVLVGSLAISKAGEKIYRKENEVHDLDYKVHWEDAPKILDWLQENNAKKGMTIKDPKKEYETHSFIVPAPGYEIVLPEKSHQKKGMARYRVRNVKTGAWVKKENVSITVDFFVYDDMELLEPDDMATDTYAGKLGLANRDNFQYKRAKDLRDFALREPIAEEPPDKRFVFAQTGKKQNEAEKAVAEFDDYVSRGYYSQWKRDSVKNHGEAETERKSKLIRMHKASKALGKTANLDKDNSTITNAEKNGAERVMVGNHGVYYEFDGKDLQAKFPGAKFVKKRKQYDEYRTADGKKLYLQTDTVNYADYKIGKLYVAYDDLKAPKAKVAEGIDISTKSNDPLGRALTNPVWGSKKDGKNYFDVETEYKKGQSLKTAPHLSPEEALRYDMNLMYKLQMQKFAQNPELVAEITKRGGSAWLEKSHHTVGGKNSRWTGTGTDSNFIKVLAKAYEASLAKKDQPAQKPAVKAPAKSVKPTVKGVDISGSKQKSAYFNKDQNKFSQANKLIARGSAKSSSNAYAEAAGDTANVGEYTSSDVVGISSEGNRKERIAPDFQEIQKAMDAGATIITDIPKDRERKFNVGERQVAAYLEANGYKETKPGTWTSTKAEVQAAKTVQAARDLYRQAAEDIKTGNGTATTLKRLRDAYTHFKGKDNSEVILANLAKIGKDYADLMEDQGPFDEGRTYESNLQAGEMLEDQDDWEGGLMMEEDEAPGYDPYAQETESTEEFADMPLEEEWDESMMMAEEEEVPAETSTRESRYKELLDELDEIKPAKKKKVAYIGREIIKKTKEARQPKPGQLSLDLNEPRFTKDVEAENPSGVPLEEGKAARDKREKENPKPQYLSDADVIDDYEALMKAHKATKKELLAKAANGTPDEIRELRESLQAIQDITDLYFGNMVWPSDLDKLDGHGQEAADKVARKTFAPDEITPDPAYEAELLEALKNNKKFTLTEMTERQFTKLLNYVSPNLTSEAKSESLTRRGEALEREDFGGAEATEEGGTWIGESDTEVEESFAIDGTDVHGNAKASATTTTDVKIQDIHGFDSVGQDAVKSSEAPMLKMARRIDEVIATYSEKPGADRAKVIESTNQRIQDAIAQVYTQLINNDNIIGEFYNDLSNNEKAELAEFVRKNITNDLDKLKEAGFYIPDVIRNILSAESVNSAYPIRSFSQLTEYPLSLGEMVAAAGLVENVEPTVSETDDTSVADQNVTVYERDEFIIKALEQIAKELSPGQAKVNFKALEQILRNPGKIIDLIKDLAPAKPVKVGKHIVDTDLNPDALSPREISLLAKELSRELSQDRDGKRKDVPVTTTTVTPDLAKLLVRMVANAEEQYKAGSSFSEKLAPHKDQSYAERSKRMQEAYKKTSLGVKAVRLFGELFRKEGRTETDKQKLDRLAKDAHLRNRYRQIPQILRTQMEYQRFLEAADNKRNFMTEEFAKAFFTAIYEDANSGFGANKVPFSVRRLKSKMARQLQGTEIGKKFEALSPVEQSSILEDLFTYSGLENGTFEHQFFNKKTFYVPKEAVDARNAIREANEQEILNDFEMIESVDAEERYSSVETVDRNKQINQLGQSITDELHRQGKVMGRTDTRGHKLDMSGVSQHEFKLYRLTYSTYRVFTQGEDGKPSTVKGGMTYAEAVEYKKGLERAGGSGYEVGGPSSQTMVGTLKDFEKHKIKVEGKKGITWRFGAPKAVNVTLDGYFKEIGKNELHEASYILKGYNHWNDALKILEVVKESESLQKDINYAELEKLALLAQEEAESGQTGERVHTEAFNQKLLGVKALIALDNFNNALLMPKDVFQKLADNHPELGWDAAHMHKLYTEKHGNLALVLKDIQEAFNKLEINKADDLWDFGLKLPRNSVKGAVETRLMNHIIKFVGRDFKPTEQKMYALVAARYQKMKASGSTKAEIRNRLLVVARQVAEDNIKPITVKGKKKNRTAVKELFVKQAMDSIMLTDHLVDQALANARIDPKDKESVFVGEAKDLQEAIDQISIAEAKRDLDQEVTTSDIFTKEDVDLFASKSEFEQKLASQVQQVGRMRNTIAQAFYKLFAKTMGAEVIFVSDPDYSSRYIPAEKADGKARIIINTNGVNSVMNIFAHEMFHHVVAKSLKGEYAAFKEQLKGEVKNWDESVKTLALKRGISEELAEEELIAHAFSRVIGKKEFYEGLAATPMGKTLAQKLLLRLTGLWAGTREMSFETADDDLLLFSSEDTVDIQYLFADMVGHAYGRQNEASSHTEERFFTAKEAAAEVKGYVKPPIKLAKGFWSQIFAPGTKGYMDLMNNLEKIFIKGVEKLKSVAGLIEGDVSASNEARDIAETIVYMQNLAANNAAAMMEKHKAAFEEMSESDKQELHDLISRGIVATENPDGSFTNSFVWPLGKTKDSDGNTKRRPWDFNNESDVQTLKERFGVTDAQIAAYKDYKKISDKIYTKLKKIFPDLQYNQMHYGQAIRWKKNDRIPLDESFDWSIHPETSQLQGWKGYTQDKNVFKSTQEMISEGLVYDTIDPNELLINYVRETTKLITFHEQMIVKASANGMGRRFANKYAANEAGYFPVNDNATRVYEKIENPVGFKVRLTDGSFMKAGRTPEHGGVDNRADAVYDSPAAAQQAIHEYQSDRRNIVMEGDTFEVEETAQGERFKTIGYSVFYMAGKPKRRHYAPKNFESEEEAKKEAARLTKESKDGYEFETAPIIASNGYTEVARMYYKKDLAKLINRALGQDKIRRNVIGAKAMKYKNVMTSVEFAWSLFHMFTIGQELFASNLSWSGMQKEGVRGGLKRAGNVVRDSQKIAMMMKALLANKDLAKDPAVIKEAEQLFGIKDVNLLEMIKQYHLVGGMFHQDADLQTYIHSQGSMKYNTNETVMKVIDGEVHYFGQRENLGAAISDTAKAMKQSVKKVFEAQLREHPDKKLRAAFHAFNFGALEGGSAWLMEEAIPNIKAAVFAREYTNKLKTAQDSGKPYDAKQIARDTMFFIEDRFGEVNWQNMWMDPTIKTSLQFLFRSFTWVMGSWKALGKAGIDLGKWGWFNVVKGKIASEDKYVLTEKGRWGINAFLMHMLTVQAVSLIYHAVLAGAGGEEVPDDEELPWYTDLFFPRVDPADPSARLSVPSYVTEFFKIARHIGFIGNEAEYSKLLSGRLSSVISNTAEAVTNSDWQGVAIREQDESTAKQAADTMLHIFGVAPISLSTVHRNTRDKGFDPTAAIFGMLGMVSAPAAERRSAATNHAFKLRQEQFRQNLQTSEEYELKAATRRAVYQWGLGNRGPLDELVHSGKLSVRKKKRALESLQYIKGRKNPKYVSNLERALKTLPTEKKLEVWQYMTDSERDEYRRLIKRSYQNAVKGGYQSRERLLKQRDAMKSLGI